ncbi:MAG: DUF4234 domain-containing protein [Planctomycetes bacterium]|nr:DUF4234 domain-containing protein [Planctomycetota bacterium]
MTMRVGCERSILPWVLVTILTGGLGGLVWAWLVADDAREAAHPRGNLIIVEIALTIVTGGIYGLYWLFRSRPINRPIVDVILVLCTGTLYWWYLVYEGSRRIASIPRRVGLPAGAAVDIWPLLLLLSICAPPIGIAVTLAVWQSDLNRAWREMNAAAGARFVAA